MAFVVAEPCAGVKDAVCIDCGACELTGPVNAIYPAHLLPPEWGGYAERNARFFAR